MSLLERVVNRATGINPESDGIKWYSVACFEAFARMDWLLHRTSYRGIHLPSTGPALIVSNHTSMWDTAKGYRMGQQSKRIIRTFTRASLLDPETMESKSVLARTGHKSDILNSSPRWLKHIIAAIPQGVEAIPVARGGEIRDIRNFLKKGRERLEAGLLVGIFVQETRHKDGKLADLMRGVELLARDNPDVPIYPAGISARIPHRVSIGKPFTYRQAKDNFMIFLGDSIANQLDPEIINDWYVNQRPSLLLKTKLP
ncbi:1-acyl-sn-glycerol-3-phosphate acyltransferase [Candidatus Daviesbacteria bacterium]|nr:1-acyl-sn-glycerol-3-phosphate acyltransferase [Candidatus Daviesbacteria bacterium]